MSSHPLPPATAERILAWFLRGNPAGRCVLGDLRQEFVALSGARTPARARRWYWSQVFEIGLRYMGLPIVIRPDVTAHRRPGIAYGAAENVRLAVRTLRRRPVFTAAAVLTLALGIGANAAMFSVVKEVILSPLPFAAADRVVQVWDRAPDASPASARPMSQMNFADYRSGNEVFSRMVAFTSAAVYRVEGEVLESVRSRYISAEFFEMMGVRPFDGRLFRPDEDRQGVVNVIVVTYEYWQRELGGEDVVGQVLPLQRFVAVRGAPWAQSGYEIIGILPPGVDLPPGLWSTGYGGVADTDIFLPFGLSFGGPAIRGIYRLRVLAELRDGVTPEQARANLQGIAAGIAEEDPESQAGLTVEVAPVVEQPRRAYGAALGFLWAATALVLFVACASVSSLLLGWGVVREQELAVRGALGAGTRRIFGQLATEALVLAGFAGVLSLGLAYWGTGLIKALAPPGMHRLDEIGVDAGVLGFTLVVSLVTVLLVGLWPALRGARRRSSEALKEAGARGGTMARTRSLRVLISAEVALSLVLLTGAGLMLQTFWNLTRVETGVARDALLRVDIRRLQPDLSKHRGDEALIALFQLLRDRVEAVPGVTSFAMADIGPLTGRETTGGDITLTDRSLADNAHAMADWNFVSPGFFQTLGVRFLAGRTFDEDQWVAARSAPPPAASDPPDYSAVANPLEVVISDAMARKFWPDQNPLGQIFHWGRQDPDILRETLGVVRWAREWDPLYPPPSPLKVVGVVTDVRSRLEGESGPTYYTLNVRWGTRLFVRTSVEPTGMAEVLRREIEAVDSEITVSRVRTIDEIVSELSADSRFRALMVVSYAVMATLITCLGLFGVLTFAMAQRTREIGVRVTLGAARRDIARLVLGQGARLAGVGIGVGLLLVVWMTRYVSSLLYGVVALDPLTLAAVTALIFGLALFAAYLPARMAMRVDPIEALRNG